ncbi:glycosyltransferase [Capnocytophaga canimorsus]|nr:glycosyltransferase [Capnocytophaga canimorsus]WGU68927.1 glycosyltransferase [Capnocytophaga canimorsus]WGU69969.1 glycosyltransferase [Capnocytophaga canimorsus]
MFLSKLNNDQYTRRCFEIPACGTMMLSERTPTLQEFYTENEEIVFF